MRYDKGLEKNFEDKNYPVDVRTISSPIYGDTYKDWDFVGTYETYGSNLSVASASRGTMEGYLKGSGFVKYGTEGVGVNAKLTPSSIASGLGISISRGKIWGKSTTGNFDQNSLVGWGAQVTGSYSLGLGVEGGVWGSFQDLMDARIFDKRKATFYGGFGGMNGGVNAGMKKPSGSTATPAVTYSTLIEPNKN